MVKVIVERIPWAYACCDTLITAEDVASASRFQNERRRSEHLAWRRVVRRELGRGISISYNEVGAPEVDTPNTHISVAHGAGCVAVAISDQRVGIDIESRERDFARASSRYMSEHEAQLSTKEWWPAAVWTAKEALYKLFGRRGVELRDDLKIVAYNADNKQITAQLPDNIMAIVDIELYDESIIVATAYFN
jgi:phosphopantetheinyl transferase